ncbi:MAG: SRPBCC family protein [Acidimicrobiales bacterium]
MQKLDHDSVTIHMAAAPETIYELFADVTRTPGFSPEILSCTWLDDASGPKVGARFAAVNKVPGRPPWTNKPVVTVVEPARAFAITRTERFAALVRQRRARRVLMSWMSFRSSQITASPPW